jgi:hypothetical protein
MNDIRIRQPNQALQKSTMETSSNPKDMLIDVRPKHLLVDLSLWALVASSLLVLVWALAESWPVALIIWVYWSQSAIIGIFWFIKLLSLRQFPIQGIEVDEQTVEPTAKTKIQLALFFLVHYGGFHLLYGVFLYVLLKSVRVVPVLTTAAVFCAYQCFSFF